MTRTSKTIDVYLEIGSHRVFAGALDWPGWCRSGRDETSALQTLAEYATRYARALAGSDAGFQPPADESGFSIVERLKGNATTDFGSPGIPPTADARPMKAGEVTRAEAILKACWRAFDRAAGAAGKKPLRKGPRGGGRELEEIVRHLLDADAAYLAKVGWEFKPEGKSDPAAEFRRMRAAILEALAAAAGGGLPARGPRGGSRWTARYFVRRVAWHALDHAWEMEDRSEG
jgi:hypothetical protein